jgi:hypothetical protein
MNYEDSYQHLVSYHKYTHVFRITTIDNIIHVTSYNDYIYSGTIQQVISMLDSRRMKKK